jgi:hypothetical protein
MLYNSTILVLKVYLLILKSFILLNIKLFSINKISIQSYYDMLPQLMEIFYLVIGKSNI